MSRKNQKQMTPEMLRQAVIGSFIKLNPLYMMKNPVMFVVEIGFFITLLLSFFPGLFGDWELNIDPVAIHIGHGIYWYGIILAFAMLAGLYLCMKQAKHYGLTEDNVMDMVLWAVPCCIIGSRIYYVLFYP